MRIITNQVMTCNSCDTQFEYEKVEMVSIPGTLYKLLICPKCGQQIVMVPEYNEPLKERIILEDEDGEKKETE